jgi:RNA polymerase sigma-70 factor (ECF subfamily)
MARCRGFVIVHRRRMPPLTRSWCCAQGGEREAFGALYDRYLGRVYAYCYRVLGNREAAEDANAEVFARALMALPMYRTGSFRSWLFAIAHDVVADALRSGRPTESLSVAIAVVGTGP